MFKRSLWLALALLCSFALSPEPATLPKWRPRPPGGDLMVKMRVPQGLTTLWDAQRQQKYFHDRSGLYAPTWSLLATVWPSSGEPTSEEDLQVLASGTEWKPPSKAGDRNVFGDFTFVIRRADAASYLMQALDDEGVAVFEARQDTEVKQIKALICRAEPAGQEEQARAFLVRHVMAIQRYRADHDAPPRGWDDLAPRSVKDHEVWYWSWNRFHAHWAVGVKHRQDDPLGRPPPGVGLAWKPAGSLYTFRLSVAKWPGFEVRSENDEGLPNYYVDSFHHAAVPLP